MEFNNIEEKVLFEKLEKIMKSTQKGYLGNLQARIDSIWINSSYSSYTEIKPYNSSLIEKIKVFLKKVIRKSIFWYVEPLCGRQSQINHAIVSTLGDLRSNNDDLVNNLAETKDDYEKNVQIEAENRMKNDLQIRQLEKRITDLEAIIHKMQKIGDDKDEHSV